MGKISKSSVLFLTLIMVASSLQLFDLIPFGLAQTGINVSGIISQNTTWTKTNSPYTLTGAIGIISGTTLTIEEGVTIDLGNNYIQVNGTLVAIGRTDDPIFFNEGSSSSSTGSAILFTNSSIDWNEATNSGSIIKNAVFDRSSIQIDDASPKISNSAFNCRISTFGGSPLISYNVFEGGDGIVLYGSNETIIGNIFSDTSQAIYVGGYNCAPLIENNLIVNNGYGIIVPSSSGTFSPIIRNNTIANNTEAITIAGGGNPSPTILYNNIYGSRDYNFRLSNIKDNINASYNYWGTTDEQKISQSILDYKKDFNLGNVTHIPFLTQENTQATPPSEVIVQLPTPTPIPPQTPTSTPTPIPVPNQSFFFVESNSTVTELFFNSTNSELSFTVNGSPGTAGYVKVTIAKSLVTSIQNVKVYLDGEQLNAAITSSDDYWLLSFNYMHSTHHVIVSLNTNTVVEQSPSLDYRMLIIIIVIIVVVGTYLLFYFKRQKVRAIQNGRKTTTTIFQLRSFCSFTSIFVKNPDYWQ